MHTRLFYAILLLLICSTPHTAQHFSIETTPEWATINEDEIVSKVNKYEVQSGYYFKSYQTIYHFVDESTYVFSNAKILNSSGIENYSQVYIPFDTSYQQVKIHSYTIKRAGELIDKTQDIHFNLINQENELGANVYSGIMVVHAIIDDVRKNDEIMISYTIQGVNPLHKGNLHDFFYLQGINHIDYASVKAITPRDFTYKYQIHNATNAVLSDTIINNERILELTNRHVEPAVIEESMSINSIAYDIVELSSFDNWTDMQKWANQLFEHENSTELEAIYQKLYKKERSKIENATAIVDYVQNEIRYTSINGGIGSFKASAPSMVLNRRYGDCKDKSLLLAILLQKIGYEKSYPVLVNSSFGKSLKNYLAGYNLFNHVIVKTEIDGRELWIDPTISLQGGNILHRESPNYGYGLIVDKTSTSLSNSPALQIKSTTNLVEHFNFEDLEGDGMLEVITVLTGQNANAIRQMYDYYSPKDISDQFKEVYSKIFLDVRTDGRVKVEDDFENNSITLTEKYIIGKPWEEINENSAKVYRIIYEPLNIYNYISPSSCDVKIYPIDTDENLEFKQKTTFKLPEDSVYRLANFTTDNALYTFSKIQKIKSLSESIIDYSIVMKTDLLLPEDFKQVCEDINKDYRKLQLVIVKGQ